MLSMIAIGMSGLGYELTGGLLYSLVITSGLDLGNMLIGYMVITKLTRKD